MPSPPFIINGVSCALDFEGMGERCFGETSGPEGRQAWMRIKYPFLSIDEVRIGLLGSVSAVGRTIVRTNPFVYPADPTGLMICTSMADFTGQGYKTDQGTGYGFYDFGVSTAGFSIPTYSTTDASDLSHQFYVSTKVRTSTEIVAPPKGAFYFGGTAARPLGQAGPGVVVPHAEIESVRHYIPYPFLSLLMSLQGKVNQGAFVVADKTFAPETVYLVSADFEPTSDPGTGLRTFDIAFHLMGNDVHSWNEFLSDRGIYERVTTIAGVPPYQSADFNLIYSNSF